MIFPPQEDNLTYRKARRMLCIIASKRIKQIKRDTYKLDPATR
jgi:hypothetical protein